MTKIKNSLSLSFFRVLKCIIVLLPRTFCLFFGRILGMLVFQFDSKHRSIALSNLKSALGKEYSSLHLKRIAKGSFQHFGEVMFDIIKFAHLKEQKKKNLVTIEGEAYIQEALREGKGTLLFSAHFGNWEIAPFFISQWGKLSVIARPLDNVSLEKELLEIRKSLGAEVVYKHQATRQTLRLLRAKEMVAILIDQNVVRNQAIFIDFFGRPAATTPSLATFHLRTSSPLIPVFCYPTPLHKYHIQILKPLEILLSGDSAQDILKITQLCTKIIEEQIRKHPKFWLWFHNRWKTRPEGEL